MQQAAAQALQLRAIAMRSELYLRLEPASRRARGFDVDLRNSHGHTLAMVAAQNNQKAILKQLYRFGVEVNEQDYKGNTALHYAQLYGYTALAEYMISKLGADETLINKDGASCWVSVEEATEADRKSVV